MQSYIAGILPLAALSLAAACASGSQAPAAKAAGVERLQCDGSATTQDEVQLLRTAKVLRFEPIYSHVPTANNNTEDRVNGAKLLIRPPKAMSAEEMTRILQCHGARVMLGQANGAAVPNDPYWLADAWVNIDVKPEEGNFAVTVSADSIRSNLEVLGRASHYADDHMLATEPGLP
jgi:hypothetical protein